MRLVGPRQDTPRKCRRRGDDGVISGHVKLLDKKRTSKKQVPVIFLDQRPAVRNRRMERYIAKDEDIDTIVAAGFNRNIVMEVVRMINRNEYKRRQAPPGIRITERAFGKDRRYPITSGY